MTNLPRTQQAEARAVPAVLYAAKSTEDKHGSIPTQLADCRREAEAAGRRVLAEETDENASAFKGNRGPGLAEAKRLASEAAAEHGGAELWVQHSDRLARGDGLTADHVAEVYFATKRQGVRLRSVQDDDNLQDAIRAVLIGERNTEDSSRKAAAVQAGIRRSAERGNWLGGVLADGYRVIRSVDARGDVHRTVEYDPDRKEIYDLIWELARRSYSAGAIVKELDARGYRTRPRKHGARPRPFDGNRVRQTLDNAFYAGLSVHRGEVVGEGRWPAFVTPEDYYRLRAERAERSHVERRGPGRPPEGYLLARLAVCGHCGSPMDTVTGHHVRKDGSRGHRYVCRTHRERPGDCSAKPIDAALVDPAVIDNLDTLLGDMEAIRSGITASREAERGRLKGEAKAAQEEARKLAAGIDRMSARIASLYADGEDRKAEGLEEALARARAQRDAAETRLRAAVDALADRSGEDPSEEDQAEFFTRIRADLTRRVNGASGDVKRLNLTLADLLDSVTLLQETEEKMVVVTGRISPGAFIRIHPESTWNPSPEAEIETSFHARGGNPQAPW